MKELSLLIIGLLILSGWTFPLKKKPRPPGFTSIEIQQAVADCENKARSLDQAKETESQAGTSKRRSLKDFMKRAMSPFAKNEYDKCMEAKGLDPRSAPRPDHSKDTHTLLENFAPSGSSSGPESSKAGPPYVSPPGKCFPAGESRTNVIGIIGIPDRTEKIQGEDWFWYENSYVQFDANDKVKNSYNAGNLKCVEGVPRNIQAPAGVDPRNVQAQAEVDLKAPPQDPAAEAIASALQMNAKGDYDGAIALLNKALLAHPTHAEIYIIRASLYGKQGFYEKAVSDSDSAISIDPENPMAYAMRGEINGWKGRYDLAISDFTKAIELKPEYFEEVRSRGFPAAPSKRVFDLNVLENRGKAYAKIKEFDNAIADFTEAMEGNPDPGSLEGNYCNRAKAYMDKFIAANKNTGPAVTDPSCNLAMKDFGKALQLNPDSAGAYRHRAILYLWRKEYDKSWADVHRAQSLGFDVQGPLLDQLKKASGREE